MTSYIYVRETGYIKRVTEAPQEYNYLLRMRKGIDKWYEVDITDYKRGVHLCDVVPPEGVAHFEQANVAVDLCHRCGFIMELTARYAFAFTTGDINMFIL